MPAEGSFPGTDGVFRSERGNSGGTATTGAGGTAASAWSGWAARGVWMSRLVAILKANGC